MIENLSKDESCWPNADGAGIPTGENVRLRIREGAKKPDGPPCFTLRNRRNNLKIELTTEQLSMLRTLQPMKREELGKTEFLAISHAIECAEDCDEGMPLLDVFTLRLYHRDGTMGERILQHSSTVILTQSD